MKLTIGNIINEIGRDDSVVASPSTRITNILTDSRSLTVASETLFFALTTAANDGHRYIGELYDRGVRSFVVEALPKAFPLMADANFIIVDNTLEALQKLAAANRRKFNDIEIVAIAGSRGKTILKEWIFQALSTNGSKISRSPRSFNSQIGVALSVMTIDNDSQLALIEAGISQRGEMKRLRAIIDPTIGIFTNLYRDHSEGFNDDTEKCREKMELFSGCREIVFCVDNPIVDTVANETIDKSAHRGWSLQGKEAFAQFTKVDTNAASTTLSMATPDGNEIFEVGFTNPTDIENVCHLLTFLKINGLTTEEIRSSLRRLEPVVTRTDVVEGVSGSTLILDNYSMDIEALEMALDFGARRITREGRTFTLILGDLRHDPGFETDELYRRLATMLVERNVGRLIAVGPRLSAHAPTLAASGVAIESFENMENLLERLKSMRFDNQVIVVKGSHNDHFEQIVEHLEARRHETVLDVNLDALVHNFNFFKSRLRPETGIVCMVKAFGYGAGSYELAKTLQSQGSSYLAVAVLDEGIELRRAGITMPIMVLNPRVVNYEEMFANRLEPEIFNFEELEEIISQARRHGVTNYPIHIKFDTGMHRLGFLEKDLPRLISTLSDCREVTPRSMFSHLAAADDPMMDDYTLDQFAKFDRWCDTVQQAFPFKILRHILNSTGITRFPEQQHDMVRLGICLYGVETLDDDSQKGLRRVSSLRTTVISIKDWPAGTTIGYNRKGKLTRPSRIATIPIGYADGIDRHLGNGAMKVWIKGHRCPTVGNICMDACMIDVTDCGGNCHIGDSVEIFGDHVDVSELSDTLDTIPYEILTSVSMRVKRVYYRE